MQGAELSLGLQLVAAATCLACGRTELTSGSASRADAATAIIPQAASRARIGPAPEVDDASPDADAGDDASVVDRPVSNADTVIRGQLTPRARRCYRKGLETDPLLTGRVVLGIHVAADGTVDSVKVVKSNGLSREVLACILSAAKGLVFDAPGTGGSQVTVPLNFI
jgi:TonB family protein